MPAWALLVGGVIGVPKPRTEPAPDPALTVTMIPAWLTPTARPLWLGKLAATVAVLVTVAVAAVGVPAQQELRRSPLAYEPDFRGAASVVDRGFRPGDAIVYNGTYRLARLAFAYELKADPKDVFAAVSPGDNGEFYPQDCGDVAACLGKTPRVWLIITNYTPNDDWVGLPDAQKKLLQTGYQKADTVALENIRVVLLQRKAK
jgi:mannosyltransferase